MLRIGFAVREMMGGHAVYEFVPGNDEKFVAWYAGETDAEGLVRLLNGEKPPKDKPGKGNWGNLGHGKGHQKGKEFLFNRPPTWPK